MTEERLGLARGNVTKADASTVSCVHGHIEAIQVPDVDHLELRRQPLDGQSHE